jgi:pSer/pThr/pTyr-binding forkhead associated (FHA) protein
VRSGSLTGTRLTVRQPIAAIGSGKHADLSITDPGISPLHGRLELREGVWNLTALGVGNRTEVDGEPVRGEVPLSPGSTIRLGDVALLFEPRDRPDGQTARRPDGQTERTPAEPRRSGLGFVLAVLLGTSLVLGGVALEIAR